MPTTTSTTAGPHKGGAFDMDEFAPLRAAAVIGSLLLLLAIYCCIRYYRCLLSLFILKKTPQEFPVVPLADKEI